MTREQQKQMTPREAAQYYRTTKTIPWGWCLNVDSLLQNEFSGLGLNVPRAEDVKFFADAGFECPLEMAQAESYAFFLGWRYKWFIGHSSETLTPEPEEPEQRGCRQMLSCQLLDSSGVALGINSVYDPTEEEDRRLIEVRLALCTLIEMGVAHFASSGAFGLKGKGQK